MQTAHETSLDALLERPLDEGDLLSNANTVIYMGKIREGTRFRRAAYVAKHRGSACTDEIIPFHVDNQGIELDGKENQRSSDWSACKRPSTSSSRAAARGDWEKRG